MISAIIPSYRNPDYLDLCLKSATENMVGDDTEIIVILDGFAGWSYDVVNKYDGIRVMSLADNKGMQWAINAGVMQANNEYVFVVNDDNVFGTEWDERLEVELKTCRDICFDRQIFANFVLTVNQVEPTGPGMFNHRVHDIGQDVESFRYEEWLEYEREISDEINQLTGAIFPFAVKKKHFMAIGGMDTFYNSPNVCDWDMFLKWELLGFKFPRTKMLHLYHFGSVVTKKNSESAEFAQRQAAAMREYEFKWGANPHNEPDTNSKIPPDRQFRGFKV